MGDELEDVPERTVVQVAERLRQGDAVKVETQDTAVRVQLIRRLLDRSSHILTWEVKGGYLMIDTSAVSREGLPARTHT